jgi:hypothetical protein
MVNKVFWEVVVDTNIIVDLEKNRIHKDLILTLLKKHQKYTYFYVPCIIASEKKVNINGNFTFISNFNEFKDYMTQFKFNNYELLKPPLISDVSFYDYSVFINDTDYSNLQNIFKLLFPNTEFSHNEYCKNKNLPLSTLNLDWKNKLIDSIILWSCVYYNKSMLLTRDSNFLNKKKEIKDIYNINVLSPESLDDFLYPVKVNFYYDNLILSFIITKMKNGHLFKIKESKNHLTYLYNDKFSGVNLFSNHYTSEKDFKNINLTPSIDFKSLLKNINTEFFDSFKNESKEDYFYKLDFCEIISIFSNKEFVEKNKKYMIYKVDLKNNIDNLFNVIKKSNVEIKTDAISDFQFLISKTKEIYISYNQKIYAVSNLFENLKNKKQINRFLIKPLKIFKKDIYKIIFNSVKKL